VNGETNIAVSTESGARLDSSTTSEQTLNTGSYTPGAGGGGVRRKLPRGMAQLVTAIRACWFMQDPGNQYLLFLIIYLREVLRHSLALLLHF